MASVWDIAGLWAQSKAYVIGATAAATLCLPLGYCTGLEHGKQSAAKSQLKAERKARQVNDQSAGQAAQERQADESRAKDDKEARDNAVRSAKDAAPSDATNALNCERLRRAGRSTDGIPACGGR